MSLRSSLLVSLAVLALAPRVGAEEPAAPTPAERSAKLLAALAEKPPAKGFRFEGLLINNGTDLGPVRMSVEPAPAGSGAAWLAVDELRVLGPEGKDVHVLQEARLGPRLEALEGTTRSEVPDEPTVVLTWKRDGTGYAFTRTEGMDGGDDEPVTFRVESPEVRSATMAASIFFVLQAPATLAEYALETLVVEANLGSDPQKRARHLTLRVGALEKIKIGDAERTLPLVRAERSDTPDEPIVLALEEDRKGLVQLEHAARATIMRAVSGKKGLFDFQAAPKTAQAAALQAARAFAVADVDALDRITDWEGIQASLAKDSDYKDLAPEARRERVLADLRASLAKNPVAVIEGVLRGAESLLEVEDLGEGRVRVTFPPVFRNMKLVVRKVGEVWKLAEFPGAP